MAKRGRNKTKSKGQRLLYDKDALDIYELEGNVHEPSRLVQLNRDAAQSSIMKGVSAGVLSVSQGSVLGRSLFGGGGLFSGGDTGPGPAPKKRSFIPEIVYAGLSIAADAILGEDSSSDLTDEERIARQEKAAATLSTNLHLGELKHISPVNAANLHPDYASNYYERELNRVRGNDRETGEPLPLTQ